MWIMGGSLPGVQAQESVFVISETGQSSPAEIDDLIARASVEQGKKVARICGDCHGFALSGGHRAGPNLHDVAGRPIASAPGFPYSPALKGKTGEAWTNQNLDAFLANPGQWVPGTPGPR
jgi:cytochrome c